MSEQKGQQENGIVGPGTGNKEFGESQLSLCVLANGPKAQQKCLLQHYL